MIQRPKKKCWSAIMRLEQQRSCLHIITIPRKTREKTWGGNMQVVKSWSNHVKSFSSCQWSVPLYLRTRVAPMYERENYLQPFLSGESMYEHCERATNLRVLVPTSMYSHQSRHASNKYVAHADCKVPLLPSICPCSTYTAFKIWIPD